VVPDHFTTGVTPERFASRQHVYDLGRVGGRGSELAATPLVVRHGHRPATAEAGGSNGRGDRDRSGCRGEKKLIEQAYRDGNRLGLAVWCEDEAGPYQAIPQPGRSWQPAGVPARYPHEYIRGGTAKLLTLFHPATGQVRVKGITRSPNTVLHPWLQEELTVIVAGLPPLDQAPDAAATRVTWARWQDGLSVRFTLLDDLPPLRLLLILDNLAGHKSAAFVCWLMAHGIMPLYTPLGGSSIVFGTLIG
jgi:hypothetical protein